MFLVKRRSSPRFKMIVLNKLSTGARAVMCDVMGVGLAAHGHALSHTPPITHTPKHADNYTEVVHGGLELELNPPYLMYTHGDDEVRERARWPAGRRRAGVR
jgi:hypothetical protein